MYILKKYSVFIFLVIAILIAPVWTILTSAQTPNTLQTQVIEYRQGDAVLEGYLAYDSSKTGKRPGVLVVHEWKGLDEYTKSRTEQLASMGYIAFAADIYGKGIRPQTPEEAKTQATLYRSNRALLRERVNAALVELRKQPQTDSERLAAIGYCFGGTTVLELARSGADIDGVVSFHGGLDSPNSQDGKQIKSKVLVLHGADDPLVSPEDIKAFENEMREGNVDWQMVSYGRTVHSFTNPKAGNDPSKGSAYNADADRRSFEAMKLFFEEIF